MSEREERGTERERVERESEIEEKETQRESVERESECVKEKEMRKKKKRKMRKKERNNLNVFYLRERVLKKRHLLRISPTILFLDPLNSISASKSFSW